METKQKGLINRDLYWIIGILIAIIILIMSIRLSDNNDIINIISFMSSGISTALALIAIGIALKQDYSSELLNNKTAEMLERINEKVSALDYKVSSIDISAMTEKMSVAMENFENVVKEVNNVTKDLKEAKVDPDILKKMEDLTSNINKQKDEVFETLNDTLLQALDNLFPIEEKVLRLRFGLEDGNQRSIEEVANIMGINVRNVIKIENTALRKLRNLNINKEVAITGKQVPSACRG